MTARARFDAERLTDELEAQLAAQGSRARAVQEKRYLKSSLRFLGVSMPVLRRVATSFARAHPSVGRGQWLALCQTLWRREVHELRSLAIGLLEQKQALLGARDLPQLIQLVGEAKTWAHVDWLATKVLGAIVARDAQAKRALDRWARDPDFWVRRTALLCLHDPLLAGAGDFALFERLAVPMLGEREFFIRKAIGWVLRSTAKRTPERTVDFVARHAAQMSALSFREATRNLPANERERLSALRAG